MNFFDFSPDSILSTLWKIPAPIVYSDNFIYSMQRKTRMQMWVIAAPKTGSTWLSAMLENYLGWESRSLTHSYDRREQEPCLRALAEAASLDKVLWRHQHTRASKPTLELIGRASIWPIIQTRDIHDTIISCCDHFLNESTVCPMAYMDDLHWSLLDDATRLQFIVDMVAPWYFNFYAGWFASELVRNKTAYVCQYERLKLDPCGELMRICEHFGLPRTQSKAQSAVDRTARQPTRLNKGIIGRGVKLSNAQKATLARMRNYYSNIDFSAAGFPAIANDEVQAGVEQRARSA